MAKRIEKFEDLEIWKLGMQLFRDVYNLVKESKDFGLKDQIIRSSLSVPSNIAEGFDRDSNKEFVRFLNISLSSCSELRTQLYALKSIGFIPGKISNEMIEKTKKLSAMIYKFIKARKELYE